MALSIAWSDHYLTGVQSLDEQHRRLFAFLDEITRARHLGDRNEAALAVGNLLSYALMHSAFEEALLQGAGYCCAARHHRFKQRIQGWQVRLDVHEAGWQLTDEIAHDMAHWLQNHLQQEIRAAIEWLRCTRRRGNLLDSLRGFHPDDPEQQAG